jgi:crossover junction endodeoxyribonuclease RusA
VTVDAHPTGDAVLTFFVAGRPAPQGSKRPGPNGQMIEASRFLPEWRRAVRLAALRARKAASHTTWYGPVGIAMITYQERPANPEDPTYPLGAPDYDKLARAINDALTYAGVYSDDSRIVEAHEYKRWADSENPPGARIAVWRMS